MPGLTRQEAERYLYYAMEIGEAMLLCGAEVGRVEDSIRRICIAYGAWRVDVFTITSSIVTTVYGEEFLSCTQTRRVSSMKNDLSRLNALNCLSREICEKKLSAEDIASRLEAIQSTPGYPFPVQAALYAVVSAAFCIFFGGSWEDMLVSAAIGVCLKFVESFLQKGSSNPLLIALLCAATGGLLSNLAVSAGFGNSADSISIGNIMLLIPGMAFTNSIRDIFSKDMITGLVRFVEAVVLAIAVALGFTFANFL